MICIMWLSGEEAKCPAAKRNVSWRTYGYYTLAEIKGKIKRPSSLARAFYLLLKQGGDMKSVIDAGTVPKSSFKKVG